MKSDRLRYLGGGPTDGAETYGAQTDARSESKSDTESESESESDVGEDGDGDVAMQSRKQNKVNKKDRN